MVAGDQEPAANAGDFSREVKGALIASGFDDHRTELPRGQGIHLFNDAVPVTGFQGYLRAKLLCQLQALRPRA